MELEELKSTWKSQDKKLDAVLKTNELLLKKINYGKARQEFKSTLNMEIANLWAIPFIILWSLIDCVNNSWEQYLPLNFIILCCLGILSLFFYSKRYRLLKKILAFDVSIKDSLGRLIFYQNFINKYKKYEYLLSPTLGFTMIYILSFSTITYHNQNIFIPIFIIATISVSLIMYFFYKKYFFAKIEKTKNYLKELEEFESEI